MARKGDRYVVPDKGRGDYKVVKPNAQRASSRHETQGEAKAAARRISANQGGGEVTVLGRNGRIRDKDTVKPARDPNPPRDKEH